MNSPTPLLIRACLGMEVDRVPVWLMRQAGRVLPEYRSLRERHAFLTLCKSPDLLAEATLQPIRRFGMDGAILFSDILLLLEAMGVELHFEDQSGPRLLWRTDAQGARSDLCLPDFETAFGFQREGIARIRNSLGEQTALIGFSGAPFTLATYLIEGGSARNFQPTKAFMYQEPDGFHRLMQRLSEAVELYLKFQIRAGVQVIQLFDTWSGVLAPRDFEEFVLPYTRRILDTLRSEFAEVPTILFSLGTSTLLEEMNRAGAQVLSLDWKIDLGKARALLGPRRPVQGNLDPLALFQPAERLEATVRELLEKGTRSPGFIFNLGHGIHPKTPLENVHRLVEIVRSYRHLPGN